MCQESTCGAKSAASRSASAPSVIGANGARGRQVPISAIGLPSVSAMIAATTGPQIRPWHGPIPHRVKALTWFGPCAPSRAARLAASGPNQIKAFTRCGMGPCQGRICGPVVAAIAADVRGKPIAEIGTYRPRAPFKSITVGALADLAG